MCRLTHLRVYCCVPAFSHRSRKWTILLHTKDVKMVPTVAFSGMVGDTTRMSMKYGLLYKGMSKMQYYKHFSLQC